MVGGNNPAQFNDTTFTKIFIGGLEWETQRDTRRRYFEQFGEILEAVVITDKTTGRSKGCGFVSLLVPFIKEKNALFVSFVIHALTMSNKSLVFRLPLRIQRQLREHAKTLHLSLMEGGQTAILLPWVLKRLLQWFLNKVFLFLSSLPISILEMHLHLGFDRMKWNVGAGRFRPAHGPGLTALPSYHGSSSAHIQQPTGQYSIPYSAYGWEQKWNPMTFCFGPQDFSTLGCFIYYVSSPSFYICLLTDTPDIHKKAFILWLVFTKYSTSVPSNCLGWI